jgi:hypothetical protein
LFDLILSLLRNKYKEFNLVTKEKRGDVLIIEKRFDNSAGYIFLACKETLEIDSFKDLYRSYVEFVNKVARGMFKEVELIVAYKDTSGDVESTVEAYNNTHTERKPIQLMRVV